MKKLFAILFFSLIAVAANAANVVLDWVPPTTCSDNSAIANCPTTGYEVYSGVSLTGTAYTLVSTLTNANATSTTITNVLPGTRCYYLKTKSNALLSGESNRICVDVPFVSPKAPSGITIRVEVTVTTP